MPRRRPGWDWSLVFAKGAELLGYAFEKSDAQEKSGGENVFQAAMGGRSLRATAELVYGSSCMNGGGGKDEIAIQKLVGAAPLARQLNNAQLFADVGGAGEWRRLQGALRNTRG
ncbi:hypothetical protein TSOC_009850 [Tetrabaena socialis]|uniref:Uncharacterized protein n=1 Tax=Tetrabaena socialis TaxID=47790 RepID=A0A2J7ZUT8_9CHLO|nr:hypothetical protein TSOC_009850 [Tetrabaena socialis]|eukprot:PNH04043.1 hypothetical protein TSOC_009850 [Tetrabaena socialis]